MDQSDLDEYEGGWTNTKECSTPEWEERNTNDRRHDVDEPVWKEWSDPQEEYVGEQVRAVTVNQTGISIDVCQLIRS